MLAAIGTGDVFSKGHDTGSIRGLKLLRRVAPQRAGDRARQ
jgi:hypothetical protein